MAHITKKDYKLYVESYKTIAKGTVTPIGEVSAWAENEKFYGEMEAWAWLIDSLIPDWFPLNYVQGGFIAIVKKVYEVQVENRVWKAIDTGNASWLKIEQTITWAQGEINNAVTNMKNRIETDIINPIKAQTADLQAKIAQATAQLSNVDRLIEDAKKTLTTHEIRLADLEAQIKNNPLKKLFNLG
jgi:hypothetical protein